MGTLGLRKARLILSVWARLCLGGRSFLIWGGSESLVVDIENLPAKDIRGATQEIKCPSAVSAGPAGAHA